jgi:hypothetical protein
LVGTSCSVGGSSSLEEPDTTGWTDPAGSPTAAESLDPDGSLGVAGPF